ncbi:hypothetical protein L2E82_36871 [Cichorium intybus]|uniref:Uncharacterized protein n=1 Tax=Cichorium intybus TaxID=13427 RepID=A0ACB9ACL1_CICIN|nr:hypothetical protein L2E82_36871 [Cichorium intybus]
MHSLVTGAYCLGIFQIGKDPTTTLGDLMLQVEICLFRLQTIFIQTTSSVVLKEGCKQGKLVHACPIAKHRGKFHHVLRIKLIFRKKGLEMLPELDNLDADDVIRIFEKDEDDEDIELSGEWVEYIDEMRSLIMFLINISKLIYLRAVER